MTQLSKQADSEELREVRRQSRRKLLDRAAAVRPGEAEPGTIGRSDPARSSGAAKGRMEASGESEGDDGADADKWIVKEKPKLRFDDVAGLDDVKEDIRLKMIYPFEHPELAEKFGINPGGGVLLYGPPGTGKTMLAKATAGEIDATFFRISPADVLSKWVGEAEQNIKKLFDAAAAEPRAIIFIDEIEALVPARRDEGSSVMQRVVPQILQGMEGFDEKDESPDPVHGRDQRPLAARPGRPAARAVRREGLHPAAGPRRRGGRCSTSTSASARSPTTSTSTPSADAARRLQRRRHQVPLRPRGDDPVPAKRRLGRGGRDHRGGDRRRAGGHPAVGDGGTTAAIRRMGPGGNRA